MLLELPDGAIPIQSKRPRQVINVLAHLHEQSILRDATYPRIRFVHANILDVVQFTEDAQLRELGDTRHKHKTQYGLTVYLRTVEVTSPHLLMDTIIGTNKVCAIYKIRGD